MRVKRVFSSAPFLKIIWITLLFSGQKQIDGGVLKRLAEGLAKGVKNALQGRVTHRMGLKRA
jgi:hypothetical protein